jgi:hypothetical protein
MATIDKEQRIKFLLRSRAKKAQPDDKVDVLTKLEIVEGDKKKKKKKKRKADQGRICMEIPNKGSGSAVVAAAEVGNKTGVKSLLLKRRGP